MVLQIVSALKGYTIEASDGSIGKVSDLLFYDNTWKVRWFVVDTGNWLTGRLVLIHPAAVGRVDHLHQLMPVALTKAQVEASPDVWQHQPVSRQIQNNLDSYYGLDAVWDSRFFGAYAGLPDVFLPAAEFPPSLEDADPHLRSCHAITGYDIQANDGIIGHLENMLLEDTHWDIRYLIVDTKNWWPGKHVLLSPYAVREIDWPQRLVHVDLSRERITAAPPWEPFDLIDEAYEKRLHRHYNWPGYGW